MDDDVELDARDAGERRTLIRVLGINLTQVALAGTVGFLAQSTGLLGAALDNLGDAAVYIASLYAVGRTALAKARVARLSGTLLVIMAIILLIDVVRRTVSGSEPIGIAMIITALINAATNMVCMRLLRSHRKQGVHLEASWTFTANDMVANLGVVVSGIAVMVSGSRVPDLIVGLLVSGVVIRGGWSILRDARDASREASGETAPA